MNSNHTRFSRGPRPRVRFSVGRYATLGVLHGLALASLSPAQVGTWTPLAALAPNSINLMVLLPDATVMCHSSSSTQWYRLTPNASGSYVNGTWSQLASMHDSRLYFQSQVLRDGRLFVSGGEYGTGYATAEIYSPLTNTWTTIVPPAALWNAATDGFSDCNSVLLPDGRVLLMPVDPHIGAIGLIYAPATNTWSSAGPLAHGSNQSEASWVKLRDASILTIDPYGVQSERYRPSSNTWVADSNVPTALYDPFLSEIGPALLLPDGRAFFIGSTGHTAIYTPAVGAGSGTWAASTDVPNGLGAPDAPAAMLVNGRVLCAVSPAPTSSNFPAPTTFLEYDPTTAAFTAVPAPVGGGWNEPVYLSIFLTLPDGAVLHAHSTNSLYVYQPNGAPMAVGQPVVNQVTQNADGSFRLTGTGLNGLSAGASYGDDWQMDSNYPIVLLRSGTNVFRARTYGWSSTGVQTGAQVVSTEFVLPTNLPSGTYSLVVSASGLQSSPVSITLPFVDWSDVGSGALAGTNGVPVSSAVGSVVSDGTTNLRLTQCLAATVGVYAFGTVAVNQPLLGGLLVPDASVLEAFFTNAAGEALLPMHWNIGIPSGIPVFAQGWVLDGVGVQGFAASNAIMAVSR